MNTCRNCNIALKANARFCHKCGYQQSTSFTGLVNIDSDKPTNKQRGYAWAWLIVTIVSLICVFIPFLGMVDIMNGGGAMILIGLTLFITGIFVTIMFFKRAAQFERIVSGTNMLACWRYTLEEWRLYTEAEYKKRKKEKWMLFWMISIIALIVNIIMMVVHPDGVVIFVCIQGGIMLIIGISAFLSYTIPYKKNQQHLGKTIISADGIYMNGSFYTWHGFSNRLENVCITDDNTIIEFTYSAIVRYGRRENYTVNIPIPLNELATAFRITEYFSNITTR